MAPVRRYLRISKYSVLECRIYLDNPSLVQSWLLNPRDPVLPRVIESVRPWVLPKLREEQERTRKKSSNRKKGIKDTVAEDDFEVSIFLTETATRHSILTKHKHFHDKAPAKMRSNTNKLIGETNETPVDIEALDDAPVIREESDDEDGGLSAIPAAPAAGGRASRQPKMLDEDNEFQDSEDGAASPIEVNSDTEVPADDVDDKKKMVMDVSYEGFAIHGRVLCLVVKKKGTGNQKAANKANGVQPVGQAKMENWITSTQIPVGEDIP